MSTLTLQDEFKMTALSYAADNGELEGEILLYPEGGSAAAGGVLAAGGLGLPDQGMATETDRPDVFPSVNL